MFRFIFVNDPAPILDHFLARVHRKWMILRTVERIGLCILIACVLGAILAAVLIWRGEPAMNVVIVCLVAGAIVGFVVGWMTRPSLFDAAAEVDRQLNLSDLLATALSIRRQKTMVADSLDQQWSATIVALAESRCRDIARESLMLRRFGIRAWGGIGLCTGVVLTLGMLSSNPLVLQARNVPSQANPASSDAQTEPQTNRTSGSIAQLPTENETTSSERSRIDGNSDHALGRDASSSDLASAAAQDNPGSGAGRTNESTAPQADLTGTSPIIGASTGELATGGGQAGLNGSNRISASTPTVDSHSNQQAPPWQSSDWTNAQQRASDQIRNGEIPDAYRDLVHDYFAR